MWSSAYLVRSAKTAGSQWYMVFLQERTSEESKEAGCFKALLHDRTQEFVQEASFNFTSLGQEMLFFALCLSLSLSVSLSLSLSVSVSVSLFVSVSLSLCLCLSLSLSVSLCLSLSLALCLSLSRSLSLSLFPQIVCLH